MKEIKKDEDKTKVVGGLGYPPEQEPLGPGSLPIGPRIREWPPIFPPPPPPPPGFW